MVRPLPSLVVDHFLGFKGWKHNAGDGVLQNDGLNFSLTYQINATRMLPLNLLLHEELNAKASRPNHHGYICEWLQLSCHNSCYMLL